MKYYALTYLLTLLSCTLLAQSNDPWFSFWNNDSSLIGFKDKNGIVKIEPKFTGFTTEARFENIIAVTEEINGSWNSYYLTKTGRMIGKDSLHIFDNSTDCENEGFIRFHDRETDKVGMFNIKGDIAIPATYNDITRVRNGMIIALTGAKKKQLGELYIWEGGRQLLIDTNNNVVIDNFQYDDRLNFYSLRISSQPDKDSIRQNFKGVNGQFYSFINYNKEFRSWLKTALLDHFTKASLLNCSFKEITFWKEPAGWISKPKRSVIDRNFDLIKTKLIALKTKDCEYDIFDESLNSFIYESAEYKNYFNDFGEPKDWIYPVKNIVISYKDKFEQDHFEFLRTENGYKLIGIHLAKGMLR